jgi:aryl-alcohol dehydrogenase
LQNERLWVAEVFMRVRAAVIEEQSAPFAIEDLELGEPRADEVVVRIVAAGICQTDLHVRDQEYPVPLPAVLGHEGAGVVEQLGSGVSSLAVGDHVVLTFDACGHCRPCRSALPSYCDSAFPANFGGARLDGSIALTRTTPNGNGNLLHGHFFGQSSFATHALASERNAVKVPDGTPLELLAPLGCGFQTGAGAVMNSLSVPAGSSIAVLGTGAVGLAAVMAAKVVGASPIVAVDINDARLKLASELGATHVVNPSRQDLVEAIAAIAPVGVDYVLEITARPQMLKTAVELLAPLGTAALIGGAPAGTEAPVDMTTLLFGRTLRGIVQGDSVPHLFIPRLIELFEAGRFPIDRLVRFYDFEEINQAVTDMSTGATIKPVLRVSAA